MIKKLRVKLIIASMASLLLVLAIIMGAIGILNYQEVVSDADNTLAILAANDGAFPDSIIDTDQEGGGDKKGEIPMSPELPYESRYFSVVLTAEGEAVSVDTGKIAAVDTSNAITYAQQVLASGKDCGFLSNYRYICYTSGEEIHVIFLDCGRSLNTFRSFLVTSGVVSAFGLLAVLLLMILLSGRIVKPFSENYEKQRRFITDAGHELKTPLTIIDADAEVLGMDLGENEWLSDIQSQTKRLADLTNSLIMLSRMEEEQPQSQMIDFPLSDVAEETVETFQALARTQNKQLTGIIQPMITYCGDEKAMRRLITILLDNAVKYSDPGGTISLTLERQKNQIRLCVFNTAEQVSRESLPHLFDRFYRTDQSRNSQTGGYGLGLSIASAIVKTHRGKISASTQDEKSLLITVTLPVRE